MTKGIVRAGIAAVAVIAVALAIWQFLLQKPSERSIRLPVDAATTRATQVRLRPRLPVIGKVEPDGFKTTSNSGTSMELVGVARYPLDGTWWKPDGSPHKTAPPQFDDLTATGPTDMDSYALYVRLSWKGRFVPPQPELAPPSQVFGYAALPSDRTMTLIFVAVLTGTEATDVGLAIEYGSGGIERIVDARGATLFKPHEYQIDRVRGILKVSALEEGGMGSKLRIEYVPGTEPSPFVNAHTTMALWDAADKSWVGHHRREEQTPGGGFLRYYEFQIPPSAARRFYYGVRPVEYAEFQNISLRQGKTTSVTVIPLRAADLETSPVTRPGTP